MQVGSSCIPSVFNVFIMILDLPVVLSDIGLSRAVPHLQLDTTMTTCLTPPGLLIIIRSLLRARLLDLGYCFGWFKQQPGYI